MVLIAKLESCKGKGIFQCPVCLKEVIKLLSPGLKALTCSYICRSKLVKPWNFKGRIIDKDGYILIKAPDGHPNPRQVGKNGRPKTYYLLEHRFVMETFLGRYLSSEEVVHHKNGIKTDNRVENLEVFANHAQHMSAHSKEWNTKAGFFTHRKYKRVPVTLYDFQGTVIKEFRSITEAADYYGISQGGIHDNVNGKHKYTKLGIWKKAK